MNLAQLARAAIARHWNTLYSARWMAKGVSFRTFLVSLIDPAGDNFNETRWHAKSRGCACQPKDPESVSSCKYANRRGLLLVESCHSPTRQLPVCTVPGTSTLWSLCKFLVYNQTAYNGLHLDLAMECRWNHQERMYEALKCTSSPTGRHGVSWWWWFCMWLLNLMPQLVHKTDMQVQTSVSSI